MALSKSHIHSFWGNNQKLVVSVTSKKKSGCGEPGQGGCVRRSEVIVKNKKIIFGGCRVRGVGMDVNEERQGFVKIKKKYISGGSGRM